MPAINMARLASEINGKENNTISRMLKRINLGRLKLFCIIDNNDGL